jgi:hypothetical protein
MVQASAESAVGAGDWIEETTEDLIAEAKTERQPYVSIQPNLMARTGVGAEFIGERPGGRRNCQFLCSILTRHQHRVKSLARPRAPQQRAATRCVRETGHWLAKEDLIWSIPIKVLDALRRYNAATMPSAIATATSRCASLIPSCADLTMH